MVLVRERGNAMAEAAAVTPTGMTAVLGGDREEVLAALERHGLTAANDNGPGQVVAAGTTEQLAALAADPPAKARLMPLSVAGAFHTEHMAPAVGHLARLAGSVSTHDPRTPVISNKDGQVVHDGRDVLRRIVGQVAHPVRWDLCLETMADLGVTGILEMPPAGTLTGIAKRALPGVETFALKTPDQLDDARAFMREARRGLPHRHQPHLADAGVARQGHVPPRQRRRRRDKLDPGATIGDVASPRDRTRVAATHGGQVVEWLVEDGDLVSPGQPLVRLHPEGALLMTATADRRPGRAARRRARHRRLPPRAGGPQRRDRRGHRLLRRVDPAALRDQAAPLGHARGDGADDVGRGRARGPRDRRASSPADRLRDRRHGQPHAADARRRHAPSPTSSAPTARPRSTSPRPARASATAWRWPPTWSVAAAPATCS